MSYVPANKDKAIGVGANVESNGLRRQALLGADLPPLKQGQPVHEPRARSHGDEPRATTFLQRLVYHRTTARNSISVNTLVFVQRPFVLVRPCSGPFCQSLRRMVCCRRTDLAAAAQRRLVRRFARRFHPLQRASSAGGTRPWKTMVWRRSRALRAIRFLCRYPLKTVPELAQPQVV